MKPTVCTAFVALLVAAPAGAQQSFRVGDAVSASPTFSNSDWQPCTVTAVLGGGSYGVVCGPRRTEYVVRADWMRPRAAAEVQAEQPAPAPGERETARRSAPPAAAPAGGGRPAPGVYRCSGAMGRAGTMRLTIHSGTQYSINGGARGTYSVDARTGHLRFQTGSWREMRGRVLRPGQIGVTTRTDEFYGTTCDRE
ncbi:MAG TPA: hypothetical protein VGB66_07370 [Longimicrobium sp.]|jgi:hypothetical protein